MSTIFDGQQCVHPNAPAGSQNHAGSALGYSSVAETCPWLMDGYRDSNFAALITRVTSNLRHFFQTDNEVLCFPGSNTAGMEAIVVNLFSPGDRIAVISSGYLGDCFATVAKVFGLAVEKIEFPWGQAADPEVVVHRLRTIADLRGVLLTHVETSTGVMNDLPTLVHAVHDNAPEALIALDASGSLGCIDVPMDALGLDAVFTGSQKTWMFPPGLMAISISPRAMASGETPRLPCFYWHLTDTSVNGALAKPPFALPVALWHQLDTALTLMRFEGREAIFARHAAIASYVHQRLRSLGFRLLAASEDASDTVTVVEIPEKFDLNTLDDPDQIVFAPGLGKLAGAFFSINHMVALRQVDITAAIDALERCLVREKEGLALPKHAFAF